MNKCRIPLFAQAPVATIPIAGSPGQIAVVDGGNMVLISRPHEGDVVCVDAATRAVVRTVAFGSGGGRYPFPYDVGRMANGRIAARTLQDGAFLFETQAA